MMNVLNKRIGLSASFLLSLASIYGCSDSATGTKVTGADPGVLEAPIAYVRRPIPVDEDDEQIQSDLREPLFFSEAGGDVYIRSNSTVTGEEINISSSLTRAVAGGRGDVKDLFPSFDGTRLLFSMRMYDPNPNDDETPTWNIYEYDLVLETLRRVIDSTRDLEAEKGDDVNPAYLPGGRIIFASNRQTTSSEMLTNEFKPTFRQLDEDEDEYAMMLHVMDEDGQNIKQITFNQSHDLFPSVMANNFSGQVVFTRWDNAAGNNAMHLYRANPDGTDLQVLYGVHSHDTGATNNGNDDATIQFSRPLEMEDGRLMVLARPYGGTFGGGDIVLIDIENYANNTQPVYSVSNLSGPAQGSATINPVSTETSTTEFSLGGRYSAAWPLWDGTNRLLVSKSTCELDVNGTRRPCIEPYISNAAAEEVSPVYSIWLYDLDNHSQKPVIQAESGTVITDIVALQPRTNEPVRISDLEVDPNEATGNIHIRSVYDFGTETFDGCFLTLTDCTDATGIDSVDDFFDPDSTTPDQHPARFVRFIKSVALPDEDDPTLMDPPDLAREAFGPQRNLGMREIIGYAPVEPDGSVKVKVPANIPLTLSVLDSMGRRIGPRKHNWFTVRPGETLECTGCHTETTSAGATPLIHHRRDAEAPTTNPGLPASGEFANTVIPGTANSYTGTPGQSMAEVRFDSVGDAIPPADEPQVSVNLEYVDYWTDPATAAASFSWEYANLNTQHPIESSCQDPDDWDYRCRVIINYPQHIETLWSTARAVDLDSDTIDDDATCTTCHANTDAMDVPQVPAGQLNLTTVTDPEDNDPRSKSYLELFFTDAGQITDDDGNLVNDQIEEYILDENGDPIPVLDVDGNPVLDIDGNPVYQTEFIDNPASAVNPSMSGNGARASYFIDKMTSATATRTGSLAPGDGDYLDHSTMMSPDEIKLVIEWLDIGAQYFNDAFDPAAPMN